MKRDAVLAWLAARRPPPPEALRAHLIKGVHDHDLPLPEHLAGLGRELLAGVNRSPERGRALALDLLAADALVTYAFEAQAEADPRGLDTLAQRVAEA